MDVVERAAYRNRWALEFRRLCEAEGRNLPFEPVRLASLESSECGEELTNRQIADRVRACVGLGASTADQIDAVLQEWKVLPAQVAERDSRLARG